MQKEYDVVINGRIFRVKQSSQRKGMTISLRDLPPFCMVMAPYRTSLNAITEFVQKNEPWLKEHLTSENTPCVLRGGSIMRYMGKVYNVEYEPGQRFGIRFSLNRAIITRPNGASANDVARYVCKFYSNQLKKLLAVKLPYFEAITGLKCNGCTIKLMSSQWGNCNFKTAKITFNSYLIAKEEAYIDYVIVHELAHIRYNNHGTDFKVFVKKHCPEASKKYVRRPPK